MGVLPGQDGACGLRPFIFVVTWERTMRKENDKRRKISELQDRLITFAVRVIDVVEALPTTCTGNHIAGQLLRCGTSAAPNYAEAQSAESRNDFIHKMKICLKELRESLVWLLTIQRKPLIQAPARLDPILDESDELIAIFVSSIATAQRNNKRK